MEVILIRELACITVYDRVHNDLDELNSVDANFNSQKRKPDSFDANLSSLKRKLDSFDPNLNILKRIFFIFSMHSLRNAKLNTQKCKLDSVDANLNSLKRKLASNLNSQKCKLYFSDAKRKLKFIKIVKFPSKEWNPWNVRV